MAPVSGMALSSRVPGVIWAVASLGFLGADPDDADGVRNWLETTKDPLGGYRSVPLVEDKSEQIGLLSTWYGLRLRELVGE